MRPLAFLFCLLPASGEAGSWLREDGRWFVSTSTEIGDSGLEDSVGLYAEYGLTEATTLSADISYSPEFGLNHARVYVRRPLFEKGRHVVSYATGVGWGKETIIVDELVFATVGTTSVFVGLKTPSKWTATKASAWCLGAWGLMAVGPMSTLR